MVNETTLVPFLTARGLLPPDAPLDEQLEIEDASRRNRSLKLLRQTASGYLVKQDGVAGQQVGVAHEAAIYGLLAQASALAPFLPRCLGYDPSEGALVIELLPDAVDLSRYHQQLSRFPAGLAAELGAALAALHRIPLDTAHADVLGNAQRLPWVLRLDAPDSSMLFDSSAADLQLVALLQRAGDLAPLLDELRRDWRATALIHHDVKWDNIIVLPAGPKRSGPRIRLVDWELAGVGDPCWDAGGALSAYLSCWLLSIPITGDEPPDRYLELARYPLAKMQGALRAFWRSYSAGMGLKGAEASAWLLRTVRYGAARLLQTAYEHTHSASQLGGSLAVMLQLSLNIMRRPREAAAQLLGLPPNS
jgi:hypothetical protein